MKSKKHMILAATLLSSAMLVAACGNNDETVENVSTGAAYEPEQEEVVDDSLTSENPELEFGFRYFNLHIDTPNNKESVIAEYYGDSAITETIYKNMHAAVDLQGDAAFTLLQQVFADLQLTQDTSKEEVITQVTNAFDATDYTNFDLEIEYEDGETKSYVE
ncbi:YusW family protein [Psychrobacillus sp. NPDC096426]|uniref:YusW family protein n=1 Tax=Psychrobacillus sp. NPDC096426 TaxID=3364491 RepID=UPI00380BB314